MRRTVWIVTLLSIAAACDKRKSPAPAVYPRPVKVMTVTESAPLRPVRVSGSVTPWREQDISYEIPGRVEMIVDRQTYLRGQWKMGGEIRREGQVLSRIDPEPYQIARDTAEAQLHVSKSELVAAQVELDRVLPAQRKVAEVQLVRAKAEWTRKKKAHEDNAISEIELIRATADRDTRIAELEPSSSKRRTSSRSRPTSGRRKNRSARRSTTSLAAP